MNSISLQQFGYQNSLRRDFSMKKNKNFSGFVFSFYTKSVITWRNNTFPFFQYEPFCCQIQRQYPSSLIDLWHSRRWIPSHLTNTILKPLDDFTTKIVLYSMTPNSFLPSLKWLLGCTQWLPGKHLFSNSR